MSRDILDVLRNELRRIEHRVFTISAVYAALGIVFCSAMVALHFTVSGTASQSSAWFDALFVLLAVFCMGSIGAYSWYLRKAVRVRYGCRISEAYLKGYSACIRDAKDSLRRDSVAGDECGEENGPAR